MAHTITLTESRFNNFIIYLSISPKESRIYSKAIVKTTQPTATSLIYLRTRISGVWILYNLSSFYQSIVSLESRYTRMSVYMYAAKRRRKNVKSRIHVVSSFSRRPYHLRIGKKNTRSNKLQKNNVQVLRGLYKLRKDKWFQWVECDNFLSRRELYPHGSSLPLTHLLFSGVLGKKLINSITAASSPINFSITSSPVRWHLTFLFCFN